MLGAAWKLLAAVPVLFGASEAVQVELIRLATAFVGATAAIIGAYFAYRANRPRKRRDERRTDPPA